MTSAAKKVILIFILTIICLYIALPRQIPVRFSYKDVNIDKTVTLPGIHLNYSRIVYDNDFPLVLGLDLAGGSHLVFEANSQDIPDDRKEEAIQGVKDIIERRVNLFGVSEPNVQTSKFEGKDRIIVELPGVNNPEEAVALIGQTAQLEFAELVEQEQEEGEPQTLLSPTDLSGADLKKAEVVFDQTKGNPVVAIEFSDEGGKKFEELTEKNIGKALPILLDGQVVSAPIVQDKISGGSAQISGEFDLEDAKTLAIQLNAGALPIPVELVEQKTVGASLGVESVEKSIRAGVVGLTMVLLFMVLYYGKLGLVADVALIIFGIITLAIYKMIPVVLTLPGIAGFLLAVGMAVDSNILIFERFKEEKLKRPYADAMEVSFGRAWDSIRDANIATLITAFVLANPLDWSFLHVSGPVRGFAITLAIGVAVSMFTGIVVSRNLLRVFTKDKKKGKK